MSRFSIVKEDPDYDDDVSWEDDEADYEDIYLGDGEFKPFDQWSERSQRRLIGDLLDEEVKSELPNIDG